jgi:hypothetical protein
MSMFIIKRQPINEKIKKYEKNQQNEDVYIKRSILPLHAVIECNNVQ